MRSEETEQQRTKEARAWKRFVGTSLLASLLLHSFVLSRQANQQWSLKLVEPTEITIVPPSPRISPSPQVLPSPQPPSSPPVEPPIPLPPAPTLEQIPLAALEPQISLPQATGTPEGRPDVALNESPLVGSGLSEGTGGFSEGIGLNRSESPIRGSGGGARRGVPGGDPGAVLIQPAPIPAPPPDPPAINPTDSSRWAVCRRCPPPDYPRTALRSGTEGRVRVTVDLDRRGRITDVRLANSSGSAALDQSVLETVREQWRFESIAGGAENVPVEVYMTVNGSELHQQAEDWGNQTAVELPTTGFAPAPASESSAIPVSKPSEPLLAAPQPSPDASVAQPVVPDNPASAANLEVPEEEPEEPASADSAIMPQVPVEDPVEAPVEDPEPAAPLPDLEAEAPTATELFSEPEPITPPAEFSGVEPSSDATQI